MNVVRMLTKQLINYVKKTDYNCSPANYYKPKK